MKTYQDLIAVGQDEKKRMSFCLTAINEHKATKGYQTAQDAQRYYDGENPTINRYEKILYDMAGRAYADMYTANHKIASHFFGFAVDQKVSYLLGNGVTFGDNRTKEKLGGDFDGIIQDAAQAASIAGVAFGFWNFNHLDVFELTEFVPLYDEENGALMAGIRWWQVDENKPLRITLYEVEGITDYIKRKGENITVLRERRGYKQIRVTVPADGTTIYDGGNYPTFPIVPLRNGKHEKSDLTGKRNTIDALDIATSQMVNNTDEGALIYWVLTNCNGMSDMDDAKFIDRLRTTHVAHVNGDDGATITPQTVSAPVEVNKTTIDEIKSRLYEDFRAFDYQSVVSGNQTATAIRASYFPLDLDTDKFEKYVTKFILGILELAGIEDKPSYTRNKIINASEETQTVLMGAQYYDDEYITKKLLSILGDVDQFEALQQRKIADDFKRFSADGEVMGNENI